ncbi:MAG TPA: metal-sensitive transcriptional regulator [Polyangiaceae bacterium]|nr:metal-sensitive transcriptional regulator [Polyangiaceae bacterium]
MDEKTRRAAHTRLKRLAGQVGGIQRMLDEGRYCVDILLQISAVQAALAEVGRLVLANHVETCLADALRSDNTRDQRKKIDEVMEIFGRYSLLGNRRHRKAGDRRIMR